MNREMVENNEKYKNRLEIFKSFGYDIVKERDLILEKSLPLNGEILEVGTGKGHFAIALARKGCRFISVDVSEEEQKFARMNIEYFGLEDHIRFMIADAGRLNFDDERFDTVFSVNMVHHLAEPDKVMNELTRVVKPGGKIVISDFNRKGLDLVGKVHAGDGRVHPEGKAAMDDIFDYLTGKGFVTEKWETEFQKTVIARKVETERS